jgi:DNA-binding winged helix-turn-helix (wHTH) protein
MRALASTTALAPLPWHQAASQFRPKSDLDARRDFQSPDTEKLSADPATAAPTEISFGPFRLLPAQFLLLEGDELVRLGSRALEILVSLLERPGEVVTKQELMARVWPNIFVEPANLTVHISALRRTLRDGRDGNRFIINIPGRGYSFVASVEVSRRENRVRTASLSRLSPQALTGPRRSSAPMAPASTAASSIRALACADNS